MSKVLLDLVDYQITDRGDVLFKYDAVFDLFRTNKPTGEVVVLDHEDVETYNRRHPESALKIGSTDGIELLPDPQCYNFVLPDWYRDLDLDEYLSEKLVEKFPDLPVYEDRLVLELEMMRERQMEDFIRTLVYMIETFEQNDVVHGVGRGSSCASLVLYLIGVHMVDPIEHEISIGEFLR